MVTLKEYEAYLKVKRFIDGHDESEIISRLMGDNKYVHLIIKSDDAGPIKYLANIFQGRIEYELIYSLRGAKHRVDYSVHIR